jgi:DNA-binding HxlR family transcriptional regulator
MSFRRGYEDQTGSLASTLEIVGERWTLLIIRDALLGVRRFSDLQISLGVAPNVLQRRLERLVEHGLLERRPYCRRPPRHEYRLTDMGLDLWPVIVSLMQWGDAHLPDERGPAVILRHRGCGGGVDAYRTCTACGARLTPREVWAFAGRSAGPRHPVRLRRASPSRSVEAARRGSGLRRPGVERR